jgi:hypothetical protein
VKIIQGGKSFWYVTDGYIVYPMFIDEESYIVCKTYMTRIEGENKRLRHYANPTVSSDFMLLKVNQDVESIHPFTTSLSQILDYPSTYLYHDSIVQHP